MSTSTVWIIRSAAKDSSKQPTAPSSVGTRPSSDSASSVPPKAVAPRWTCATPAPDERVVDELHSRAGLPVLLHPALQRVLHGAGADAVMAFQGWSPPVARPLRPW